MIYMCLCNILRYISIDNVLNLIINIVWNIIRYYIANQYVNFIFVKYVCTNFDSRFDHKTSTTMNTKY